MGPILQLIIAAGAIVVFVWLLWGTKGSSDGDEIIDPNNARQIGTLVGMMGGNIANAAAAQFALRRFEEEHGRKPTVRDMAIVAGMMLTQR